MINRLGGGQSLNCYSSDEEFYYRQLSPSGTALSFARSLAIRRFECTFNLDSLFLCKNLTEVKTVIEKTKKHAIYFESEHQFNIYSMEVLSLIEDKHAKVSEDVKLRSIMRYVENKIRFIALSSLTLFDLDLALEQLIQNPNIKSNDRLNSFCVSAAQDVIQLKAFLVNPDLILQLIRLKFAKDDEETLFYPIEDFPIQILKEMGIKIDLKNEALIHFCLDCVQTLEGLESVMIAFAKEFENDEIVKLGLQFGVKFQPYFKLYKKVGFQEPIISSLHIIPKASDCLIEHLLKDNSKVKIEMTDDKTGKKESSMVAVSACPLAYVHSVAKKELWDRDVSIQERRIQAREETEIFLQALNNPKDALHETARSYFEPGLPPLKIDTNSVEMEKEHPKTKIIGWRIINQTGADPFPKEELIRLIQLIKKSFKKTPFFETF